MSSAEATWEAPTPPAETQRRVTVQIDQEEADVLLTLLLHAAEQPRAASEVTDRLLHIFAEAQRALNRAENNA